MSTKWYYLLTLKENLLHTTDNTPICLNILEIITIRFFMKKKTHLKHWRYNESTMLRRPFTVWIDVSIFRLEDNNVLSIEKNYKTSNTKSRPITVSGARLCKYYVNTCLLKANKLHFMKKKAHI